MKPLSYADLPSPDKIIVVVGYPRSGNTWLSRLIGDVLDSPVGGYKNANPICTEGGDRPGAYYVMQLHASPGYTDDKDAIVGARLINMNVLKGERIVHIIRVPRDVAVSSMFYWDLINVKDALNSMVKGIHPFGGVGAWNNYVNSWYEQNALFLNSNNSQKYVNLTSYELLANSPMFAIDKLLERMQIRFNPQRLVDAVNNQGFTTKRKQIEMDGAGRPYGRTIQLKHMRKGTVGDWRNHFKKSDGEFLHEHFGEELVGYGYEHEPYWWESLPG